MTRFARAKGSKASNERKEEEATPWHVMRQQLADQLSSNKPHNNDQTLHSLKNILIKKPKQEEVWSEFGELNSGNKEIATNKQKQKTHGNGKILKKGKLEKEKLPSIERATTNELNKVISEKGPGHLKKCKGSEKVLNHFKKCESVKLISEKVDVIKKNNKLPENCQSKKSKNNNNTKLEKHNIQNKKEPSCSNSDQSTTYQKKPVNKTGANNDKAPSKGSNTINNFGDFKYKHYNFSSSKNNGTFQTIVANGRSINVVRYEGFLVKKSDAVRLKKLKKKLREQNIEKEQLNHVMKLERRKAEKALSREKNYVCFHCRKFGHNFAECPDIKDSDMSKSGMCFKCGSLEHSYFECKVLQNQDFRYAVCFVCKEQGHIARQCSLNPQGQYPKGGSCHLCGEVTHLRKDCPKAENEKPSSSFTAEKLNSALIEDISEDISNKKKLDTRKNKIVKF